MYIKEVLEVFFCFSVSVVPDADYIQIPQQSRGEGVSHCTGHMGNPRLKLVFNFSQSYLRCLLPHSLCTPREDGKAAEQSQGSFMKKFSKSASGTSVWGNLELKNVQSSAGSRKSIGEEQQCINILTQIFPFPCVGNRCGQGLLWRGTSLTTSIHINPNAFIIDFRL